MNDQIAFTPAHQKAIDNFAWKVWRRAQSGGARSLMLADIKQELCIAWCKARDSWKAEFNVPFGAYLVRGMQLHVNRWVQEEITEGHAASLDNETDEAASLYSAVPDGVEGQDVLLEAKERKMNMMAKMTPLTRQFVEFLDSPPAFLIEAVKDYQAFKRVAKSLDRDFAAPKGVTAAMVFDFMELYGYERSKIYRELAKLAGRSTRETSQL